MSAVLIPHPSAGLQRAREVVASPDFHTEGTVLDACEQLEAWGDWRDAQRAREIRSRIVDAAVAEINGRGRWILTVRVVALCFCAVAAIALLVGQTT